jgi:hypothetical protein
MQQYYVTDNYINTTIYDDSVVIPTEPVLPKRLLILQAIFASKGKANKILDFTSTSLVKETYGSDMEDIKKYGQGGLNVIHGMTGGASAQICRLLPDDADTASLLISCIVKERNDIPLYERNLDGKFKLDENKDKIPLTNEEDVPLTTSGVEIKITGEYGDVTANNDGKITSDGSSTKIPLFKLKYNGPGKCGNDVGIKITNDWQRDDATDDGRRYILNFYTRDTFGNPISYGSPFYFSFNPDALVIPGSSVYENLLYVYPDKDVNGRDREVICVPHIMDNYAKLIEIIGPHVEEGTPENIDIINCLDKNGLPYDNFVQAEETLDHVDFDDTIVFLTGGSDGSLEIGNTVKGTLITETIANQTKQTLLTEFLRGHIDPALFDERMVDSDIYVDANYDYAVVKPVLLGKFRDLRPDIMVIADIGEAPNCATAINLVKNIYEMVDGITGYTAAVTVHFGTTLDRTLPIRVSGTYDYIYGLARCYGLIGTFSVFCGYQNGRVQTMEMDWYPYKDEFDTMIGPLKKLGCIFALKLNKAGVIAYMAEENMYVEKNSKLKSVRNGMVIGDGVRLAKGVLIKYVYDNDGAAGAIRKATDELQQTILGRYPANIIVTPYLYRTTRDIQIDTSTCDIEYKFPGMTKSWSLNIHARRADG